MELRKITTIIAYELHPTRSSVKKKKSSRQMRHRKWFRSDIWCCVCGKTNRNRIFDTTPQLVLVPFQESILGGKKATVGSTRSCIIKSYISPHHQSGSGQISEIVCLQILYPARVNLFVSVIGPPCVSIAGGEIACAGAFDGWYGTVMLRRCTSSSSTDRPNAFTLKPE